MLIINFCSVLGVGGGGPGYSQLSDGGNSGGGGSGKSKEALNDYVNMVAHPSSFFQLRGPGL